VDVQADVVDIAVVGAGPAGLGVGIAAARAGLRCTLFDQGPVVSGIAGYPTYMTFFSTADRLELGGVPFIVPGEKPTRADALKYYRRIVTHFGLDIRQFEPVESVAGGVGSFELRTRPLAGPASYRARNVVLATGYFDTPNLLGVPGEDLPKVLHAYREAHPFFAQDCVVVGGGNSAVDAALELQRVGARVTLVHFEAGLDPNIKPWVLPEITARLRDGQIEARWSSRLAEIRPASVIIRSELDGRENELPNRWVLAMTGYTPDPRLLVELGVPIDEASGIPVHDPASMQTAVPGVFIAGVVAAGFNANKIFIENGREHGGRIVSALVAGAPPPA
jgi:thioredoxin reductase (NADPH)